MVMEDHEEEKKKESLLLDLSLKEKLEEMFWMRRIYEPNEKNC